MKGGENALGAKSLPGPLAMGQVIWGWLWVMDATPLQVLIYLHIAGPCRLGGQRDATITSFGGRATVLLQVGPLPMEGCLLGLPPYPALGCRPGYVTRCHFSHDVIPGGSVGCGGAAHEEGESQAVPDVMGEGMDSYRGPELNPLSTCAHVSARM